MSRQAIAWVVAAVVAALGLGVGATLLVTGGDGDGEAGAPDTTTSTSAPTTIATTTTAPTTTTAAPTTVAPPPRPTGTVVTVPPAATTTTARPTTTRPPATTPPPPATTTGPPATTTTEAELTAPEVGVSDTRIRVGVVADSPDAVAGVKAWAAWVNARGGLLGRKVKVDVVAPGTDPGAALEAACGRDFAVVGSPSIPDDALDELAACGLPDLPVRALTDAHRDAPTTFAAMPSAANTEVAGGLRWLKGDAAAALHVLADPGRETEVTAVGDALGYDPVVVDTAGGPPDPGALGLDVGTTESTDDSAPSSDGEAGVPPAVVWDDRGLDSTIALRRAAADAGVTGVRAWLCGAACYDRRLLAEGVTVEGQYVQIEASPLEDAKQVPAIRAYVKHAKALRSKPTLVGLESFAAGMLFERAADATGARPTRGALLDALAGIHDFDADGILGATDVAAQEPTGCVVLMQVRAGKLRRAEPTKKGTLDCGAENLVATGGP